jgi:hypothetical protein
VFVDKAKEISNTAVAQACPADLDPILTDDETLAICSKCHTQISKGHWPSIASNNNLAPDTIPFQLAALTADDVRTVSLICPFLKVVILPGGQFGEEGSVIHFPFPVQQVMSQLPHLLSDSELILSAVGVGQRETFQTLLQQLDHQRVYQALLWLRANNPLYASIPMPNEQPQTSQPNAQSTAIHDDDEFDHTTSNHFNESCVIPQNYVDPDIPIEQLLQQQNTAPQLPFPRIVASPVNMFQQEQLEEHAFPVLYPKGRFGMGYERSKPITDLKYIQSRLFNKDPRWRNNIAWMFGH